MKLTVKYIVACASLLVSIVHAQEFPSRAITWVVPFGPGQTSDIVTRVVTAKLADILKQPIVVENRPGANGRIGTEYVAKAKPDGYTVMWGSAATHGMNSALYSALPYDPIKDFVPVANFGATPIIISVAKDFPVSTFADLIKLLKGNPGKYTAGTANPGAAATLEEIKRRTGIDVLSVPYRINSAAFTDLMGGRISFVLDSIGTVPYLKSGQLKALAVTTTTRSPLLPEVPTISEAGLTGFDISPWGVLFAPSGTPDSIVAKLNGDIAKIMRDPKVRDVLTKNGYNVGVPMNPTELKQFVVTEHARWVTLIKSSGIKLE